jgi:hypothetical protein
MPGGEPLFRARKCRSGSRILHDNNLLFCLRRDATIPLRGPLSLNVRRGRHGPLLLSPAAWGQLIDDEQGEELSDLHQAGRRRSLRRASCWPRRSGLASTLRWMPSSFKTAAASSACSSRSPRFGRRGFCGPERHFSHLCAAARCSISASPMIAPASTAARRWNASIPRSSQLATNGPALAADG